MPFDFRQSVVEREGRGAVDQEVGVRRLNPAVRLRIEGRADDRASAEYDLAPGMRRANAAKQYLVGFGLDEARFEMASSGEERPLDPGHNEDVWAKSRRAELQLVGGGEDLVLEEASR